MPSWNVHIAHVERLLATEGPWTSVVQNRDAFVLGNLVPDIYVGYMVPDVSHKIPYKDTHFADPTFVPAPDASHFYASYIQGRTANDITIGAWCHLLCDHYYNLRTNEYIASIGVKPGEQTRIRKQADFNLYGQTLDISLVPRLSAEVLTQCAAFEQYELDEHDVRLSVESAERIVRENKERHLAEAPTYDLLTREYFDSTAHEVEAVLQEALALLSRHEDATHLGKPQS